MKQDGANLTIASINIGEQDITLYVQGTINLFVGNTKEKNQVVTNSDHIVFIAKQRRLQKLYMQQAHMGRNTPPEILTEIEDIEEDIEKIGIPYNG